MATAKWRLSEIFQIYPVRFFSICFTPVMLTFNVCSFFPVQVFTGYAFFLKHFSTPSSFIYPLNLSLNGTSPGTSSLSLPPQDGVGSHSHVYFLGVILSVFFWLPQSDIQLRRFTRTKVCSPTQNKSAGGRLRLIQSH